MFLLTYSPAERYSTIMAAALGPESILSQVQSTHDFKNNRAYGRAERLASRSGSIAVWHGPGTRCALAPSFFAPVQGRLRTRRSGGFPENLAISLLRCRAEACFISPACQKRSPWPNVPPLSLTIFLCFILVGGLSQCFAREHGGSRSNCGDQGGRCAGSREGG
jgi:hypothetical protein